jgi:hypothetical protein
MPRWEEPEPEPPASCKVTGSTCASYQLVHLPCTPLGQGDSYVTRHSRSSLRLLGSVGEPINPEAWRWYYDVVRDCACAEPVLRAHMLDPPALSLMHTTDYAGRRVCVWV